MAGRPVHPATRAPRGITPRRRDPQEELSQAERGPPAPGTPALPDCGAPAQAVTAVRFAFSNSFMKLTRADTPDLGKAL
jgi:hypothetical protein